MTGVQTCALPISGNANIRNINLNRKFGFELEGVFFEDAFLGNKKRDIVRMGLLRSRWMEIFSDIPHKSIS